MCADRIARAYRAAGVTHYTEVWFDRIHDKFFGFEICYLERLLVETHLEGFASRSRIKMFYKSLKMMILWVLTVIETQ